MPIERDSSFQRAIDSAIVIRLARVAILVATVVFIPAAGYGIKRVINRVDDIGTVTDKTAVRVELLDQSVRLNFDARTQDIERMGRKLDDQERRIRNLEFGEVPVRPPIARP